MMYRLSWKFGIELSTIFSLILIRISLFSFSSCGTVSIDENFSFLLFTLTLKRKRWGHQSSFICLLIPIISFYSIGSIICKNQKLDCCLSLQ